MIGIANQLTGFYMRETLALNGLRNPDTNKASQDTDNPTRTIKENSHLLPHFVLKGYNEMLIKSEF